MNPVIIKLFTKSNSSYPKSSLDITGWSYQPSVDDVN